MRDLTGFADTACRDDQVTGTETPFLVCGTLHGRPVRTAVASPAEVLAQIVRWCTEDPEVTGYWLVDSDYREPISLVARFKPGHVGESRRVAHVFQLRPGAAQGGELVACCGQAMALADAEWLPLGYGMPCERCLAEALRRS